MLIFWAPLVSLVWGPQCSEQAAEKTVVGSTHESSWSLPSLGWYTETAGRKAHAWKQRRRSLVWRFRTECVACKAPRNTLAWRGGRAHFAQPCHRVYSLALQTHHVLHSVRVPITLPPLSCSLICLSPTVYSLEAENREAAAGGFHF